MGLKAIFDSVLNMSFLKAVRTKFNTKIDNKLLEFIQPLSDALDDTKGQLNDLVNMNHDTQNMLHNTIQLIQDTTNLGIDQHNQLIDNQEESFRHAWLSLVYPEFCQVLERIAGGNYPEVLSFSHLLLFEISKKYLHQGNIWQLGCEINSFKTAHLSQQAAKVRSLSGKPERMKILVVSAMFPSIEHGGGNRLFDIISELSIEHEVDLFSVYLAEDDKHSMELLQNKVGELKIIAEEDLNQQTLIGWLSGLKRQPNHYHVIQCEYPHSVPFIESLRPFGQKIGFTFMECVTKSYLIKLQNSIVENDVANMGQLACSFWEFAVEELTASQKTDFQIAVTAEDADYIEMLSGVRPGIIPTCLSQSQVIDRFEKYKDAEPDGNTVVFLGSYNHFPNIDGVKWYLRGVHEEVKKMVPDYRFLVVGAGDISELQKLTENDPAIVYTGRVDDLIPHIVGAKVCVLPLISGAGIRGKLNQYSLARRPSVSTTIGNMGLDYQDGESVLIADNPEDFAKAVVQLLTDSNLNQSMADKAKAYAEANFTWARPLEKLQGIYRS